MLVVHRKSKSIVVHSPLQQESKYHELFYEGYQFNVKDYVKTNSFYLDLRRMDQCRQRSDSRKSRVAFQTQRLSCQ
jgi:hypothetical protein